MGFAIGVGPDLPTQANLPIQTCFTFWIRPPSWGRNTTNDDDGNDDDTHTHTLTTTKSEGGGASGGPPCPLGAVLSPPRRSIPKRGSAESRHEKTKKDHSFPLFKVQNFPTGYPGPLEVLCIILPLVQKNKNEFRLRVLSRSRLTPHGLRTLPRVAGITLSICKR